MMGRGRKTLVALDSGDWRLARVIGRRRGDSGVRVRLQADGTGSTLPVFAIAGPDAGDGFAL